jgi:Fe-S cluster assembly protein SufB
LCETNAKISWTQVETGSAVTWKYPSCILKETIRSVFYSIAVTNNFQQADTGTKMIHLGKTLNRPLFPKVFRRDALKIVIEVCVFHQMLIMPATFTV